MKRNLRKEKKIERNTYFGCSLPFDRVCLCHKCRMDTKQQTDITIQLCTTEHFVFLLFGGSISFHVVSFSSCFYCFSLCSVCFLSSTELVYSCDGFFSVLMQSFFLSSLVCCYFSFFPTFTLFFYGSFAGLVSVLACGSVSSIQYDIILFFFELCKLVSQHDTTGAAATATSNVEVCSLYIMSIFLGLSHCLCLCVYAHSSLLKLLFVIWWVK